MGPSSRSFAAEAHLLLHGPGPARIQPNTRLRRELRAQLAGSPRFVPSVSTLSARRHWSDLTGESPYKRLLRSELSTPSSTSWIWRHWDLREWCRKAPVVSRTIRR